MTREFSEAQQMLCLAALTYRDFADVDAPHLQDQRLHEDIASKLREIPGLQGQWELVWGPVTYRAPLSLFDDTALYVAQCTVRPDQYVIAVRGTNPISAFDWIFGDFWIAGQVPWQFDDTKRAQISLSAALGLDIILQLRSSSQPSGRAAKAWGYVEEELHEFASNAKDVIRRALEKATLAPIREELRELASRRRGFSAPDRETQVKSLRANWAEEIRQRLLQVVAAGLRALGAQPSRLLLTILEEESSVSSRLASGHDLVSFLKAAVACAKDRVDVVVTGHSKGGALSPTLALWLAETQGAAPEAYRWDAAKRASLRCYAFAGPTAGNAAFAERSDRLIGAQCHRIFNRLDIVPRAWVPGALRGIAGLYGPEVAPIPGLSDLVDDIATVLDKAGLDYTQVGNNIQQLPGKIDTGKTEFVSQLVYQHLQAYLNQMEICVSIDTFLNPLP